MKKNILSLLEMTETRAQMASQSLELVACAMEDFICDYLKACHEEHYTRKTTSKSGRKELKKQTSNYRGFYPPDSQIGYNELRFRLKITPVTTKADFQSDEMPTVPALYVVHRKPGQKLSYHFHHNTTDHNYSPALTTRNPMFRIHADDKSIIKSYVERLNYLNAISRFAKQDWLDAKSQRIFLMTHFLE